MSKALVSARASAYLLVINFMTVTPTTPTILDQVEIGIEPSAANHADWLQFEDPIFRLLQKVVAVDDPNPNNEGRTVHEVRAVELVMPDNWDEAPSWRYGIKAIGLYGKAFPFASLI